MRTTVTIADDVYAAMERLREEDGLGTSEALNLLARRGLSRRPPGADAYRHRSADLGIRVDVANVGEVLDLLDQDDDAVRTGAT